MKKYHFRPVPPQWADRFLRWYCASDLLEEVQGDVHEMFFRRCEEDNVRKARLYFVIDVFRFFNYSTIRGKRQISFYKNTLDMYFNYLKIAFRNIKRNRLSSFINTFGIALGIACFVLIGLYVQDELIYDRFHKKADNIYRVSVENFDSDGTKIRHWVAASPGFVPLLVQDYAAIEAGTRVYLWDNPTLTNGERKIIEESFIYAEPDFLNIFTFPFIEGNPKTALNEPNSLVLTEAAADRYFTSDWREKGLIGKTLIYNNEISMKITGVMKNVPEQSHLQFEILATFSTIVDLYGGEESVQTTIGNFNFPSYVLLKEGTDIASLNAQMLDFGKRHIPDRNGREFSKIFQVKLEPLVDIHLNSNSTTEYSDNGQFQHVMIFGLSGIMILVIACINYMNLATARYTSRMKEVGIRKVIGAKRSQLIGQFLMESVLLTFIAFLLSALLIYLGLPEMNEFTGKKLGFHSIKAYELGLGILVLILLVGLISGSYPAFFLSRFIPIKILKQGTNKFKGSALFRSSLVVFQFTVSIILISSLGVVQDQLSFIRNKDLGFNKEQILRFYSNKKMREKWETVKNRIENIPGVTIVTGSSRIPTGNLADSQGAKFIDEDEERVIDFRLANVCVDPDFFTTYNIELLAGRFISKEFASDSLSSFILNEIAIRKMGFENVDEAIGKPLIYGGKRGNIVGVVKDFHFESLHTAIAPIIFYAESQRYSNTSVKLEVEKLGDVIDVLTRIYKEYEQDYPFGYTFINEEFDNRYRAEMRLGKLFKVFAGLAILIGCMGLLALASFTAERRIKEIGIRKILGANIISILTLLSKQFIILLLISFIVATPLTWYFMQNWLKDFAYHTHVNIVTLLSGGIIALIVSLITVSWSALKSAFSNPVETLKSE
ncbi:MAG: ABC transporter permease [Bacteroidota bacterium]